MFEANCSRQMGQHKKKIFHQMFLCLHGGVTKVRVSDADRDLSDLATRGSYSYPGRSQACGTFNNAVTQE